MSQTPLKQARNKNAIETAILNHVLDRDLTLNRRGPLRLSTDCRYRLCNFRKIFSSSIIQRAAKGGGKLRGGGKHTVNSEKNPSPKTFFGPPHLRYVFPPPPSFGDSLSFPLKERDTDQTNPNFLRPPKVVLESTLCQYVFPPNSRDTFPPPPSAAAQIMGLLWPTFSRTLKST